MKVQIEEVSPEKAAEWLKLSLGNRQIQEAYAKSLAVDLKAGRWIPEASDVVFDTTGALIDGHHRLWAVVKAEVPAQMCVKRGVPPEARNVIDTGRSRSLTDLLNMYRDLPHVTSRKAALTACVQLLTGIEGGRNRVVIRTLDSHDMWFRQFKDGIEWVVTATRAGELPTAAKRAFGVGPVMGAFAFAHKLNPEGIEKIHRRAALGERLEPGEPTLTLRNFILVPYNGHNRMGMAATARRDISLKVLSGLQAALQEQPIAKLMVNSYSLPFFRAAYKGRSVDKLVEPWETPGVAQKSESV